MKVLLKKGNMSEDIREDFHWGTAIAMMLLVLGFIAASFYILISSYLEIN